MDSETALQVAWIGVLAGAAGGGVAALIQYVVHRIGSRLRWRDLLRDAAADFTTHVTAANLAATYEQEPAEHREFVRRMIMAEHRLQLLAPRTSWRLQAES